MSTKFTTAQVKHIGELAQIPITEKEAETFAKDFSETLTVIDNLQSVNTTGVEPTHQVTNLENIWREDEVSTDKMLSQAEALSAARQTHEGFFVVKHLLENKDA